MLPAPRYPLCLRFGEQNLHISTAEFELPGHPAAAPLCSPLLANPCGFVSGSKIFTFLPPLFALSGARRPPDLSLPSARWRRLWLVGSFGGARKIGATRKTGGSNWGYKPPLLTRASRRGFSLCSSLSVIATLAAPKGAYLTNGSSYSFTLSLSTAISCFSWSLIYFLIVSSLRPTVLT